MRPLAFFAGGFAAGAIAMWALILWTLGDQEAPQAELRAHKIRGAARLTEWPNA